MQQGYLTISRPSFGNDKRAIVFAVVDGRSHVRFLEVEIDYAAFTEALTGVGHVACEFELQHLDRVGRIREHKTELVPVPGGFYALSRENRSAVTALLATFEVDGWSAHTDDLFKSHNYAYEEDGCRFQKVGFVRYVDLPASE